MKTHPYLPTPFFRLRHSLCLVFVVVNLSSLVAQSTVVGLRFNGQTVNSAKANVLAPAGGGNKSEIKTGDKLASGTKLIIPAKTIVALQSPGGKQVLKSISDKPMEYTFEVTAKGENHVTQGSGAQIQSTVTKTVGYNYRVNNGKGTTAASKGTEFTFTDNSESNAEKASITTEEGTINIIDEVPVKIDGAYEKQNRHGGSWTTSVSRLQSAGDGEYNSTEEPVNFGSYDEALLFMNNLDKGFRDPIERADNLICLGQLYTYIDEPKQAIDPFSEAVETYTYFYGNDDFETIEANLYLAEAFQLAGQPDNANSVLEPVAGILEEEVGYIITVLKFVFEDEPELQELLCEEKKEVYGLLGWLYEIKGEAEQSNEYYNRMDSGCN